MGYEDTLRLHRCNTGNDGLGGGAALRETLVPVHLASASASSSSEKIIIII